MSCAVVVGGGQLRRSVADSAGGVKALRTLRAEGQGVEEDPPRRAAGSQSLEEFKVGPATCAAAAAAATDHPRHGPLVTGEWGRHGHGGGQSRRGGSEQDFWGRLISGVGDGRGGAVAVQAAGWRVRVRGLGLRGLCVRRPAPAGEGVVLSLDAGTPRQGGGRDHALQVLNHRPAIMRPADSIPSSRGVCRPAQFTSGASVLLFHPVAAPLLPLRLLLLLPLAVTGLVRGHRHALLRVADLLQTAARFGGRAFGIGPQLALPPVLRLDGGGEEFVPAFNVGVTLPPRA